MCENPRLIFNPNAQRLFSEASMFFIKGNQSYNGFKQYGFMYYATMCGYLCGKKNYEAEEVYNIVDSCYIIVNGQRINAFVAAPCGRCNGCLVRKQREWKSRILFEASVSGDMYFVTLTYANKYLPTEGVNKDDISKFNKAVRTNLAREYMKHYDVSAEIAREKTQYRYVVASEYGSPKYTQRAHYHLLIFFKYAVCTADCRYQDYVWSKKLENIFFKSWSKCIRKCFRFELCRDKLGSANYISKYVTKQVIETTPEGKNLMFVDGSRGHGGIGNSEFIRTKYKEAILKMKEFCINLRFGNKYIRVKTPSILVQSLFKTFGKEYVKVNDLFFIFDYLFSTIQLRHQRGSYGEDFHWLEFMHEVANDDKSYIREGFKRNCSVSMDKVYLNDTVSSLDDETLMKLFCHVVNLIKQLPSKDDYFKNYLEKQRWLEQKDIPKLSFSEQLEQTKSKYVNQIEETKRLISRHKEIFAL